MWEEWYTEKVEPVFAPSMIILNSVEIIIYIIMRHLRIWLVIERLVIVCIMGLTWTLLITG